MWLLNSDEIIETSKKTIGFQNVLTPEECELVKSYEKVYKEEIAKTFQDKIENEEIPKDTVRKSNVVWLPSDEKTEWLYRKITDFVNEINEKYYKFNLTGFSTPQLTKYYGDKKNPGHYASHVDDGNSLCTPANMIRKLSITIALSGPDEYKGGELELYPSSLEPMSWEVQKGEAVTFPSFVVHKVNPVQEGVRYSLVIWIMGPRWS